MRRTDLEGVDPETHRQTILKYRAMEPRQRLEIALEMTEAFFAAHRQLERMAGRRISLYREFDHLYESLERSEQK